MSTAFLLILFVVVGSVVSYAAGYFRERKVPDPPEKDPDMPKDADDSLRTLYNAYSEEVRARYMRNHARRRSEKFLKEFWLASFHFAVIVVIAGACAQYQVFEAATAAAELLTGLIFLTMGLKAGQLTASKETAERKELILIHAIEIVNDARRNMLANCPPETWATAMSLRDERSPLHSGTSV
ncbi:MAG: hypothetical protein QNK37_34445 [Acidobacteriota bacterium]|nr:hypothetical protein [Acidobacteriota bacterium]